MKTYSKTIANAVISVFEENDFNYNFDRENGRLTARWHLDSKLGTVNVLFIFRESDYIAIASIDVRADEECRGAVIELLTRLNYQKAVLGYYQMDHRDGEILYCYGVDCDDCIPSKEVIKASIYRLLSAFDDEKGNVLLAVMYNMMTPEQAMANLED